MERITERVGDAFKGVWVKNHDYVEAAHRLADYEDTGLSPEAITQLKLASMGKALAEVKEFNGVSIDRLRELAEADKAGLVTIVNKEKR